MFCQHCGSENQRAKAYCTRCGEWLPDLKSPLRRAASPLETVSMMIVFNGMSIFLGLLAAVALFIMFFAREAHWGFLAMSATFCLITAIYQLTSFVSGMRLRQRLEARRVDKAANAPERLNGVAGGVKTLQAADTSPFFGAGSVTDRTTDLLAPQPLTPARKGEQG